MGVRIVHEQPLGSPTSGDYVHVRTFTDPADDTVTLATIQRVVEKPAPAVRNGPKANVKYLLRRQPMSPDSALGFATCYAERKQIPVVFAELNEETE